MMQYLPDNLKSDPEYPLEYNRGIAALKHWKEHRPKMYRELKKNGRLLKAAYAAQELTADSLGTLLEAGVPYFQAWEMVRENWIYLPTERDQPSLGANPANWEPPDMDLKE